MYSGHVKISWAAAALRVETADEQWRKANECESFDFFGNIICQHFVNIFVKLDLKHVNKIS